MYILSVCASLCEEKHSAPIESGDYWQTFIIAKDTAAFISEHRRCWTRACVAPDDTDICR